jgi:hypothetical protein
MVINLGQTEWLLFLKMEQNGVPLALLVVLVHRFNYVDEAARGN